MLTVEDMNEGHFSSRTPSPCRVSELILHVMEPGVCSSAVPGGAQVPDAKDCRSPRFSPQFESGRAWSSVACHATCMTSLWGLTVVCSSAHLYVQFKANHSEFNPITLKGSLTLELRPDPQQGVETFRSPAPARRMCSPQVQSWRSIRRTAFRVVGASDSASHGCAGLTWGFG